MLGTAEAILAGFEGVARVVALADPTTMPNLNGFNHPPEIVTKRPGTHA